MGPDYIWICFGLIGIIPGLIYLCSSVILDWYCFRETNSLWVFISPLEAYTWASQPDQEDPSVLFWRKLFRFGLGGFLSLFALALVISLIIEFYS